MNSNKLIYITLKSYINLFKITKPTGIKDLKDLENKSILKSRGVGKEIRYYLD